jgi:putative peptidoglycan lipid II flippase
MASRLFGFVRQMVALRYFGCSGLFDAFVAATTLPNLFRRVLGEQVAESALTPTHRTLTAGGREEQARRLTVSILTLVAVTGSVLVVLGVVFAPWLVRVVVPGFVGERPELVGLTTRLARWMMPFLVIIALSAVFGSLLLSERRFLRYSLAPIGSSACIIAAVVLFHERLGVGSLALGVVAGGLLQMLISAVPYLRRRERLFAEGVRVDWEQPALRKVGRTAVPIALAGMLNRLSSVVDRALASLVRGTGRISALFSAHLLLQLPFAVFGLAVGRAAFPSLIEQAASDDGDGFSRALVRALRLNAFLMLPATVGVMLLVRPFVRLMYERGAFTSEHTTLVTMALFWYALGLTAMGGRAVLSRAFYARLSARVPFYLSIVQVGANIVLSLALVFTVLEHGGLALATSLSFFLESGLLLWMLRREAAGQGNPLRLAGLGDGLMRMALAAGGMGLAVWGCLRLLPAGVHGPGLLAKAGLLAVPTAVGIAVYAGLSLLLRCEEVGTVVRRFRGRRG